MGRLPSYKKRRRADLCAFSPAFRERVKAVRTEFGIPQNGFPMLKVHEPKEPRGFYPREAIEWYEGHVEQAMGKRSRDLPHYYWHFPKEFAELVENLAFSSQPCRAGFHPEVPLDRQAMDLVREFDLPEDVVNEIKRRILVEENVGFGLSPLLQLVFIPINEQEEGVKFLALIAGIDVNTTRKDWLDAWEQIRKLMRMNGSEPSSTKREEEKILLRDLTWWEWARQGLDLRQIADKWEEREGKAFGEDTVGAAVQRINELMNPISEMGGNTKASRKNPASHS